MVHLIIKHEKLIFVEKGAAAKQGRYQMFQKEVTTQDFIRRTLVQVLRLLLVSYCTYPSNIWWVLPIIFITTLLFLLYVLFEKKVDRTVNFYYCTALPIIHTVLKIGL